MTLVGKYQLVSKLATGGMAEVFLAKVAGPMGFEKTLVLKRILPHLAEDPQFVGMFFTEARVAAQLNHPNIVQIFDFGQAAGTYYIAMEYIDGPDLRTLARRALDSGVALSPAFCARLITAACEGLSFAHDFVDPASGNPLELIHRDISPDNILLSRQGAVKVVDFGIAKAANQSHKTGAGLIKGKLAYMPPEQLQGHKVDRRVDVYALGVVLYELLTGRYPFEASTDVSIMQAILFEPLVSAATRRPDLPEELVRIVDRALSKVREQRYPDCIELQADLERFLTAHGETVGARDLAQAVERLCPRSAEPMRTLPPGAGGDIGFADTAVRASTGRFDAVAEPLPQAPVVLEPAMTPLSLGGAVAPQTLVPLRDPKADMATERVARVSPPPRDRRRLGIGLALGGLALAAGSGIVYFRQGGGVAPPPATPRLEAPPPPVEPSPVHGESSPPPGEPAPARVEAPPAPVTPPPEPVPAKIAMVQPVETPAPVEPAARPAPVIHKSAARTLLTVYVQPYAIVFLDGTALGMSPIKDHAVSPGEHIVRLVNRDSGQDISRTIDVKAGKPFVLKQKME